MDAEQSSFTDLLQRAANGSADDRERLYSLVYDDLREAAQRVLRRSFRGDYQTTALVNESLLRFEKKAVLEKYSENRRVFFSVAIRAMQQVLIDHYRRRKLESSQLNSEGFDPFDQAIHEIESQTGVDFSTLHGALEELKLANPRQHLVIIHRFFGGLTIPQTAEVLGVSEGTVERDWRLARAKLLHRLKTTHE